MNKSTRNIIIVALFAAGGGWLGIWLNSFMSGAMPRMESLGALIWLTTPALSGLFLRAFAGDGWKDSGFRLNLFAGWKWYLTAAVIYPLAALLTFALAWAVGVVTADGFLARGFGAYVSAAGIVLTGSLIKNIFEEFAWRGYLTPRLEAANIHPMLNHLIVGVLWWSWHLPYYFYFLDRAALEAAITTSFPVFLAIGLIVMLPTSILFGELRLLSKSVWTTFLLHNFINALSMPLLANGFLKVHGPLGFIFTPTNEGIVTSLLFGAAGWILYRYRMKTTKGSHNQHVPS